MKKLKRIKLTNFQSHRESEMDFHPGINAIVGSTDSGKSAILRGLGWTAKGKPAGDWMISNWATETEVELETDETTVVRNKGKESSYTVSGIKYSAFGASIPDQVQKALPFQEPNIAEQLDAPFLISLPDGQIAQFFNDIIGLGHIDASLSEVGSRVTKGTAEVKKLTTLIETTKEKMCPEGRIELIEANVAAWESCRDEARAVRKKLTTLSALLDGMTPVPEVTFDIDLAIALCKKHEELRNETYAIALAIQTVETTANALEKAKKALADFMEVTPMCDACGRPL